MAYLSQLIRFLSFLVLFTTMVHCLAAVDAVDMDSDQEPFSMIELLKNLSLEELTQIETFNPKAGLAARKIQKLTDTPAALFVITQEDIRRAGITHLAEALRMVPGMQVVRMSPSSWAISARGLNHQWISKLLVMIDGRTVYSSIRSQVNWDSQDLLMEDVERIEVIRGPGASLWGANAVNGIINIITKSAKNTQGHLLTTHIGTGEEQAIVGMRQGGELGSNAHYRVYGKFYKHDNFVDAKGDDQKNDWEMKRGGFRLDWDFDSDILMLQGDVYDGFTNPKLFFGKNTHNDLRGFNLLARWQRDLTEGDIVLQTYYDQRHRRDYWHLKRHTYDIDFQHRWQMTEAHELIWGLGFRRTEDNIEVPAFEFSSLSESGSLNPPERQDNLFNVFMQSEFKIYHSPHLEESAENGGDLRLILGSKFEHNDYTGFEIQPTARLLWNQNNQHILWVAISRAVRTPSRIDEDFRNYFLLGNPDLKSEVLLAYELGYRFNLTNRFLLEANLFYNDYDKLRTVEFIIAKNLGQTNNQMDGEVYGLELVTHWQITKVWKLISAYSYINTQLHPKSISNDFYMALFDLELMEGYSPRHQASLRSQLNLSPTVEFDTALYYVGNLPNLNVAHYTRFDVRLGWQPQPSLQLSLGVRNLFDNQHNEFAFISPSGIRPSDEVQRAFYLQMKYQF
jgi:iron complex outermembrane receptor protein